MSEFNQSDIKLNNINRFDNSVYSPTIPIEPTSEICPTAIPDEDYANNDYDEYIEWPEEYDEPLFPEDEADTNSDEIEISKHEKGTVKNERYQKGGEVYISDETEYDENGNIIRKEINYNTDGGNYSEIKEYDNKGRLVRIENDNDGDGRADYTEINEYNENDILIKYEKHNNGAEIKEYNENGNLINHERDKNGNGKFDYQFTSTYYENGNKESETNTSYRDDGSIKSIRKLEYNENGSKKSETNTSYRDDGSIDSIDKLEYNENGYKKSKASTSYRDDGTLYLIDVDEYDGNGKLIKEYQTYFNEKEEIIYDFQYETDEDNNRKEVYIPDFNNEINYTMQGQIGDCWLLAGINSLSYSEAGRKILNNAVTRNDDGSFSVYFKGIDTTIKLEEEEIKEARESGKYSKGDNDMLVWELAFESAFNKIQNKETDIKGFHLHLMAENKRPEGVKSIDGGNFEDVIYMLTGKDVSHALNIGFGILISNFLRNAAQNENIAIQFGFDPLNFQNGAIVKDIYGNDIYMINDSHSFSIKSINGENVVIVNPWDSSKEFVISIKKLIKYGGDFEYIDLNQFNVVKKAEKIPRENRKE